MAVLDKNKVNRTSDTTESTSTSEGKGGRVVDILQDKSLPTGEKHKLDASEDAWEYGAPPKAGRFSLKCFLAKDGVVLYDDDKSKPPGYGIALECKVVNSKGGEADGVTVFPRVTTFIARGKNISTAAGLVVKFGYKIPAEADAKSIATLLVMALKKEPVCDVELDWRGWSRLEERAVYKTMAAFPTDEHGEPIHIVDYKVVAGPHKGEIDTITAQPNVVHWYGKGEASKPAKGHVAVPKKEPVTLAPAEDEGEEQAKAASVGNGVEDDLQLLEE